MLATVGMAYTTNTPTSSILQGAWLMPTAAINIVMMPLHWITELSACVDVATNDELGPDLSWMLRRRFSFMPVEKFRDHYQLALSDLQDWLQAQAAIRAQVRYEHLWGDWYKPGMGLLLDCFDSDQQ